MRPRSDRYRQGHAERLSPAEFGCHGDEFTHGLELAPAVESGAQARGRGNPLAALEPGHDVADRSVSDVGDRRRHRHGRVAGGGDGVWTHAVQSHSQELRVRFSRRDSGADGHEQHRQQAENHSDDPGCDRDPQRRGHVAEPRPFVRESPEASPGDCRVLEWVWVRSAGVLGGSGGNALGPSD